MAVIRAGAKKGHLLCFAMTNFALGQALIEAADKTLARNAHDLLADSEFATAGSVMEESGRRGMQVDADDSDFAVARLKAVHVSGAKLMSALRSWSRSRVEEMAPAIQGMFQEYGKMFVHAVSVLVDAGLFVLDESQQHLDSVVGHWATAAGVPDVGSKVEATAPNGHPAGTLQSGVC